MEAFSYAQARLAEHEQPVSQRSNLKVATIRFRKMTSYLLCGLEPQAVSRHAATLTVLTRYAWENYAI